MEKVEDACNPYSCSETSPSRCCGFRSIPFLDTYSRPGIG
jgi:hypothetical protein